MEEKMIPSPGIRWEKLKPALARSSFRSRFHLTGAERVYLAEKGWPVIRAQARAVIEKRLAPAFPENDGKQTPMRGHAVFKAQHATGSCCRGCLEKWQKIPSGRPLTEEEIDAVTENIIAWLVEQAGDLNSIPHTPDLWS